MTEEIDPAAEFLAREQNALADLDDSFQEQKVNGNVENGENEENGIGDTLDEPISKSPVNENGLGNYQPIQPEPEKIRIWREEHQKLLKIKDENEAQKEIELKEQAKKELEDWYERYRQQLSKSKQINRNAEKEFIADRDAEGDKTENWEKIAKLCDFGNSKVSRNVKDTSRLRTILLQLKQNQTVN